MSSIPNQTTAPKSKWAFFLGLLDQAVQWLKWPSAIAAALVTPLFIWALVQAIWQIIVSPTTSLIPFLAGAFAFGLLWSRWLSTSRLGTLILTVEHELTHAIFAFLTGHSITGFGSALGQGGEIRIAGKGNWLITCAPYFFPTATIVLFLLAFFLPFSALPWQSFLLGVALVYHIVTTIRECHRDSSELRSLGKAFCWLFLPAANLAVTGLLIAFGHSGSQGISQWWRSLWQPFTYLWQQLG